MSELANGQPQFFNVDRYLDATEDMINADEVERAFWMLDNLPAYYRDHVPARAIEIKESLHRQLFTAVQYLSIGQEIDLDLTLSNFPGRAQILQKMIERLNSENNIPHLMDYAPGAHWIQKCLLQLGLRFTYEWKGLDYDGPPELIPEPDAKVIFTAFEIIEHLSNEWEIYQNYLKFSRPADIVMLSTPFYSCPKSGPDWRNQALGHLRTYTPVEFMNIIGKMFQGFEWECFTDETIILIGKKK